MGEMKYQKSNTDFLRLHLGAAEQTRTGQYIVSRRIAGNDGIYDMAIYNAKSSAAALDKFKMYRGNDYYITINQMKANRRGIDQIFTYNNIVLDVDAHGADPSDVAEALNVMTEYLGRLPHKPNSIVFTGRGIQLWWACAPLPARTASGQDMRFLYDRAVDILSGELLEVMALLPPSAAILTVDVAASNNAAGLFRLPGTYNTKAEKWSHAIVLHSNRLNISDTVGRIERATNRHTYTPHRTSYAADQRGEDNAVALVRAFTKLRDLRRLNGAEQLGAEERNNYIYCLHAALIPYVGQVRALNIIRDFNRGFLRPLSDSELNNAISWTLSHNSNGLKKSKIVKQMNISPEEQIDIGLVACGNVELMARADARELKAQRDELILAQYGEGVHIADIAVNAGCSERTVRRVLERVGAIAAAEQRARRISDCLAEGYSPAEAADLIGCSVATIYNHINSADSVEEQGEGASATFLPDVENSEILKNDKNVSICLSGGLASSKNLPNLNLYSKSIDSNSS